MQHKEGCHGHDRASVIACRHLLPVHEMILDLVQHHVAVTSTLPVFEM